MPAWGSVGRSGRGLFRAHCGVRLWLDQAGFGSLHCERLFAILCEALEANMDDRKHMARNRGAAEPRTDTHRIRGDHPTTESAAVSRRRRTDATHEVEHT